MADKGHRGALVTVAERKTLYALVLPVKHNTNDAGARALKRMLAPLADCLRTITYGNGREFSGHLTVSSEGYFAKPYSGWERGTNENTNGLRRGILPKSMPLRQVTVAKVERGESPSQMPSYRAPKQALDAAMIEEGGVALSG